MDRLKEMKAYISPLLPSPPTVAVVCGSGLSHLSQVLEDPITIPYTDIPGDFPMTSVQGHSGEFVYGSVGGMKVICMRGRFHSYEGHVMSETTIPIRLMYMLGCSSIIVTNAVGGINADFEVGDIMVMSDHIGLPLLAGKHPLVGPNEEGMCVYEGGIGECVCNL